ncbi:hypothetical protein GCM10010095_21270 [Streptomyces anthocyanicus]|nr:hypothetical protein GCM10010095_21270 [Streptomyces anthocyanicus]
MPISPAAGPRARTAMPVVDPEPGIHPEILDAGAETVGAGCGTEQTRRRPAFR